MKKFLTVLIIFWTFGLNAQNFVNSYIEKYKDIAIEEMNKTGIPASITLAQGMLESNWGRSELAKKAKNHFGIKADNSWTGKIYKYEDDEFHKGKLIKSKFRVYNSPEESFIDHSEFIAKKKRYEFLFKFDITDYKSWTKGLLKAGYATDPKYNKKLNLIIEKYGLWEYDMNYKPENSLASETKKENPPTNSYTFTYINKSKAIIAHKGETPKSIAKKLNISYKKILKYNDGVNRKNQKFNEGDIVFLSSKRKRYYGNNSYYSPSDGETIVDISQKFGLNAKYLAKINKIKIHKKLKNDQRIKLKPIRPNRKNIVVASNENEYLFDKALTPNTDL